MEKYKIIIETLVCPEEIKYEILPWRTDAEAYCRKIGRLAVFSENLKDKLYKYYSKEDFNNLLKEYNCEIQSVENIFFNVYFINKESAQKFIDDILIPLDIVKKLIGKR